MYIDCILITSDSYDAEDWRRIHAKLRSTPELFAENISPQQDIISKN